jgi:mortality factor 4-like protein 1
VSGLKVYFDKALGSNLLYRFERPQYADMRKRYVTGPTVQVNQEREMSAIYGAEHLLRMIGLLPSPSLGAIGLNITYFQRACRQWWRGLRWTQRV